MLQPYLPVLLVVGFVVANAILMLAVSHIFSTYRRTPVKVAPYESGMPVLGDARERFSVKFYLVAMLFIIFDIETVFMIPWGVLYRELSCAVPLDAVTRICPAGQISLFGLAEMLVFIAILLVGLVYVWKKGALQWD
jgi:NADH-quinone oxidoreductase subunit A